MSLFIAIYKLEQPQLMMAVIKEALALRTAIFEGKLPEGIELCVEYSSTNGQQTFFIWRAPSKEALETLLNQYPVTKSTLSEIIPVRQGYPATEEYILSLYQSMIMPRQ